MIWLYVSLGGAIGAVCRYWLTRLTVWRFGISVPATLSVNVIGSFLLGFILAIIHMRVNQGLSAAAGTHAYAFFELGVLGGFTTFSTFIFELHDLLKRKPLQAFSYLVASLLLCVVGIFLGYFLAMEVLIG